MVAVDGGLIVLGFLYVYFETRRGFFCSFADFCGMMLGVKVFYSAWKSVARWYLGFGMSKELSFVLGSLTAFLPFVILMFFVGWVVYNMTLISVGDAFEPILAFLSSLSAFLVLAHFVLTLLGGLGNEALKTAILHSFFGREIYTLETVHYYLRQLKPLTNPGDIYL